MSLEREPRASSNANAVAPATTKPTHTAPGVQRSVSMPASKPSPSRPQRPRLAKRRGKLQTQSSIRHTRSRSVDLGDVKSHSARRRERANSI